ncbi:Hypothetical_protein [Hexamita inflata]|uniref:Hypothetical_protein n=1 Tax=Hexamita inflata TaxID=28002 RepID=A0ABP1HK66_9EUKA
MFEFPGMFTEYQKQSKTSRFVDNLNSFVLILLIFVYLKFTAPSVWNNIYNFKSANPKYILNFRNHTLFSGHDLSSKYIINTCFDRIRHQDRSNTQPFFIELRFTIIKSSMTLN